MLKKIFLIVAFTIIIFASLIAGTYELAYQGKIYPGVKIGSFNTGNKSPQEAKTILKTLISSQNQSLKLIYQTADMTWTISPQSIDFSFDPNEPVQKAYLVGRQGNLLESISGKKKAWEGKITIPLAFSFNQEKLNQKVTDITIAVFIPSVSPKIYWANNQIIVDPGQPGQELDQRRLQNLITSRFVNLDWRPINLPLKTTNPPPNQSEIATIKNQAQTLIGKSLHLKEEKDREIILTDKELIGLLRFSSVDFEETLKKETIILADQINQDPQDALFKFEKNRVTAFRTAKPGQELDQEKTSILLKTALEKLIKEKDQAVTITLPIKNQPPRITNENVNNLGIKELLGKGISFFHGSSPSRIHNIQLAASLLNGLLVPPQKTFSFNQSLGEISQTTGYQKAYIIKNGRTILGDGGGVCQVSTTLFRAILNTGLPVIERYPHAYRVYYYEEKSSPGIDATVFSPSPDLKFKNDTDHYLLIQSTFSSQEKKLTFSFYGTSDNRQVTLGNFRLWDIVPPPPPLYTDDPTLPKGETKQIEHAVAGAKAAFDWQVIRSDEVLQKRTFYSAYQPWKAVYLRGTKED